MNLTRRRTSEIASLVYRKYRERHGQYIVEGTRAVESALSARAPVIEVIVAETHVGESGVTDVTARAGERVHVVSPDVFARLSDVQTAQGILAVVEQRMAEESDVIDADRILALDGLQDPGNVGTILRTAAWFGIRAVVAGKGTADVFAPKTVRATMGGIFDLDIHRSDDLAGFLERASEAGARVVAADMHGTPLDAWTPPERAVLVVGNEGAGISDDVAPRVAERVTVRRGAREDAGVESLNVAIATGIVLHAWTRS